MRLTRGNEVGHNVSIYAQSHIIYSSIFEVVMYSYTTSRVEYRMIY